MGLKEKIKELREAAGMNKAELGRKIGVSDVTINYWETGKVKSISSDNLLAVAGAFGLSVSELLDDPLQNKPGLEWAIARCKALQSQGFERSRHDVLIKDFQNCINSLTPLPE